jgi:hypothetical protein
MDVATHQCVVASSPCGICVTDSDGRILCAKPPLNRLTGWQLDGLRGQPVALCPERGFVEPAQRPSWTVAFDQALLPLRTANVGPATDFWARADDADTGIVNVVVSCWQYDGDHQRGELVVFHVRELPRDRGPSGARFLAVLTHELGIPRASLATATESVDRGLDSVEPCIRAFREIIQAAVAHLERMTGQGLLPLPACGEILRSRIGLLGPVFLVSCVAQTCEIHESCYLFGACRPEALSLLIGHAARRQHTRCAFVYTALPCAPLGTQITPMAEEHADWVLTRLCGPDTGGHRRMERISLDLSSAEGAREAFPFYASRRMACSQES